MVAWPHKSQHSHTERSHTQRRAKQGNQQLRLLLSCCCCCLVLALARPQLLLRVSDSERRSLASLVSGYYPLHRARKQSKQPVSQPRRRPTDRQARSIALAGGRPCHRKPRLRAMEEQLGPVAVTHLLQHTLRSLCTAAGGDGPAPQWVYAVFWRILPRNYPPPKCVPSALSLFSARSLLPATHLTSC